MGIEIDPEEQAALERARADAQQALQRAKAIVERSRTLLWSQDVSAAAADAGDQAGGEARNDMERPGGDRIGGAQAETMNVPPPDLPRESA